MDLKMEVYTPGLELVGVLEIHRSVIWEDKAFSAGSFSLDSIITTDTMAMLQPENIIWIEGETAGVIEYIQESADQSGPYITIKGRTLTGILDRRILWGLYNLKGTAPEIMHALVNDCCVDPTRGSATARKIPGLVLLDAPAGGDVIQFQKTGGSLLDTLEQLGETYGVSFGIRFNPAVPRMEFWTRWGQNRSVYQSDSGHVLYSTELDDVLSSEYLYNSQDYRNVALVGGEGEGNERVYVTVENEDETPDIPVPPKPPEPPVTEMYTVTLLVDPAGGGIASGGRTVEAGTSIAVTASPSSGYEFTGWQEHGQTVSTSQSYTFTVTADRTLTAVFASVGRYYTISAIADPPGGGTVSGTGKYSAGSNVTLKATANDGYTFSEWHEVDGSAIHTGEEYTFVASKDASFVALFKAKPAGRLPEGYTEVEYIETDQKSGINTGVTFAYNKSRVVLDIEAGLKADGYSGIQYIIDAGSWSTSSSVTFGLYRSSETALKISSTTASGSYSKSISNSRVTIDVDGLSRTLLINGEPSITWTSVSTTSYSMHIPAGNTSNSSARSINAKIYSIQIYLNGTLQRDFVPCIDPSGQAGFYDLVGGTFYKNVKGGIFTAGPAV